VERNADLGIAWDGDGDRVAFVDSAGSIVSADEVSLLLIRGLLRESGGERVVYDLKLSDVNRGCVEAMGGTAIIERSGHTFLKRRMILDNCAFGCEASGHYFYRELKGGDDGLFTALLLCGIVQQQGALLELRGALPNMYLTPDIRLPVGVLTFDETRDRVRGAFPSADVLTIDGLRLATKEGSVLVRPSVTESAFTLRLEGVSKHALEHLLARCVEVLPEFANTLKMKEGL
jgi:phosphomannomutase/phosphoglucomutase